MAEEHSVETGTTKPLKKKAKHKAKREKKKVVQRPFPRVSLETALKIPFEIKDKNGGNAWATEDIAKAVSLTPKSSAFFYMAAAARDFGLTNGSRDTANIELTPLGRELVYAPDPNTEKAKKLEAFLNVEIFKRVLDYYKGATLPEMTYLGNTLTREFGLDPSTHEEFSQLFRDNCRYLGIESGLPQGIAEQKSGTQLEDGKRAPAAITLAEPKKDSGLVAFVIMPFQEREQVHQPGFFQEVLRSLIIQSASDAGFTVRTANRQGSDLIQSTIINELLEADLVIADLTEHNPNVLFELGVRMAIDKPVALIKSTGTGRIFDVDNLLRVFEYNNNLWKTTIDVDLPKLTEHIQASWNHRESERTYMKLLRAGTPS